MAEHLAVIGAGPGGYAAAFTAADAGYDVTLIGTDPNPGGVCLHVGCIPSKALLHVAKLLHESQAAAAWGIDFGKPQIDLDKLRGWKNQVVGKLTGGLGQLAKARKVRYLRGLATFIDERNLQVALSEGGTEQVGFDKCVIAAGSRPIMPGNFPQSPLVMDSTAALDLADVPERLLVVGGGYIGLELSTVYHALGSQVTVVEALGSIASGADRDLVEVLSKRLYADLHEILVNTKVIEMQVAGEQVKVTLAGLDLNEERTYDKVLVSVGRRPNSDRLALDNAGVGLDPHGFIQVDHQRRTGVPHIFAIGDLAGQPMLAHKATYEAKIAVEAMAGQPASYDPAAIPAVVFTDPELAWCGLTESEAQVRGRDVKISRFPWAASGRAVTLGRSDGLTKLISDRRTERVLGMGIVGVGAGELIAEGVLAVEMGARVTDLQMTIHAHPTLSETVLETADLFFGQSAHFYQRTTD